MRIALDVSIQSRPEPTGVERSQALLVDALLAHAPELELHLMGGARLPPRWAAAERVVFHPGSGGLAWRQLRLPSLLREAGARLLHAPVAATPRRAPCPVIATLHELPWAEPGAPGDRSARHQLAASAALSRCARVLCPSERTATQARAWRPESGPRLVVVPHAVDPRFARAGELGDVRVALSALGLPPAGDYVLALGRLRGKKNLTRLVNAWRSLPRDGLPAALVLAGPHGDAHRELAALAARPGATVQLPGYVPDELLPALVAGARVLAAPSLLEGFGLTALEAMAAGVPVLAARQGPVDEAVGDAALRVDGTDEPALARGLATLVHDEAERARRVAAGRELAAARSPRSLARALCALYRDVS